MAWELYLDEAFGPHKGGKDVIVGGWVDPTAASSSWLKNQVRAVLPDVGWPLHATELSGSGLWVCAALTQSVRQSQSPAVVQAAEAAVAEAQRWFASLPRGERVVPDSVWRDRASFERWIHVVPRQHPPSPRLWRRLAKLREAVALALVDLCRDALKVEGLQPPLAVFAHLPAEARPDLRGPHRLAATIAVVVERVALWVSVERPARAAELRLHPAMSGGLTAEMLEEALAQIVLRDGAPKVRCLPLAKYDADVHAGLVLADWILHRVTASHSPWLWSRTASLADVHRQVGAWTGLLPGHPPRSLAAACGEPRQRVLAEMGAQVRVGEPASGYRWHEDQAVAWIGEL